MTDLRTAAQAVIDTYELGITTRQVYYGHLLERNIEALRQALAEPVEYVMCSYPNCLTTAGCVGSCKAPQYITPPSVDALIAEIESIPTYTNLYPPFPDNAPPCGKLVQKSLLDEITDKYRGVR